MTKKKRANVPDQPITTLAYSPMVNRDLAKREAVELTHAVLTVYSEFRDQQEDKIDMIMQHLNDMNAACVGLVTATLADNIARGQGTLRGIFKVMPLDRQLSDSLASWKTAIDDYMLWLDSWERQHSDWMIENSHDMIARIEQDYLRFKAHIIRIIETVDHVRKGIAPPSTLEALFTQHSSDLKWLFAEMRKLKPRLGRKVDEEKRQADQYIQAWCAEIEQSEPGTVVKYLRLRLVEELAQKEAEGVLTDVEMWVKARIDGLPEGARQREVAFNNIRTGRGKLAQ